MPVVSLPADGFAWVRRLIEPRESVSGREARRRARYTALCFVLLVPLGLVALSLTFLSPDPGSSGVDKLAMLAGLVLLVALYPVSRGPRYAVASHVAIAVVSVGIWGPWLASAGGDAEVLYFTCIPLIMAGLLVGPLSAAVFALGNVTIAFSVTPILVLLHGLPVGSAFTIPFFLLFVGGFAVNAAHLRDRDLREVEELASELAEHERRRVAMLNNIAHDLGSPLTPVKLQLAMASPERPIDEGRLAILRRNVKQLERLVSDIQDLARVEAGGFKLHHRAVDVAELAQAAVASFEAQARAKGVALTFVSAGAIEREADPERLTQVLYNLLTNAIKFTPPGGEVRVEAYREAAGAGVRVRDSGRGLAPDEIGRLFQPFSQVHDRSEVAERGTGLGLYISKGIMRAHGGDLTVASDGRGRGATFALGWP